LWVSLCFALVQWPVISAMPLLGLRDRPLVSYQRSLPAF
jgi:hypothetical protein